MKTLKDTILPDRRIQKWFFGKGICFMWVTDLVRTVDFLISSILLQFTEESLDL